MSGIERIQLLQCRPKDFGWVPADPAGLPPVKEVFRRLIAKGDNHSQSTPTPTIVLSRYPSKR